MFFENHQQDSHILILASLGSIRQTVLLVLKVKAIDEFNADGQSKTETEVRDLYTCVSCMNDHRLLKFKNRRRPRSGERNQSFELASLETGAEVCGRCDGPITDKYYSCEHRCEGPICMERCMKPYMCEHRHILRFQNKATDDEDANSLFASQLQCGVENKL